VGAVLSLRNLRQRRGGREVLRIDRLDVAAGEQLAVLGPNGAGKTTLLRLLAGLEAPVAGTVEIDGVQAPQKDLDLRRRIGYATQRPGLLSTTVRRNVELPLRWRGMPRAKQRTTALAALERLGVADLADRPAFALSGGEAQRVSLARALAVDPAVLLLDEPAAGLDAQARVSFLDDLEAALAERTTTVVHVSHRADEALQIADRVAVLVEGAIHQIAPPSVVIDRPADGMVARLIGYENVIVAEVDPSGEVLIAGKRSGLRDARTGRKVTVAAWGTAIELLGTGSGGLEATVERVSPSAGYWNVVLAAAPPLRAKRPLDEAPPQVGDRVVVRFDPVLTRLIGP
jgi:ABC-type sulfate/molybdate transport systems ATPase subunit